MKIIKEQWRLQIWPPRVCLSSTNKLGACGLLRPLLANCGGPLATSFQIFNGVGSLLLFAGTSVNASPATMAAERLETARTLARDDARMRWLWSCRDSPSSLFQFQPDQVQGSRQQVKAKAQAGELKWSWCDDIRMQFGDEVILFAMTLMAMAIMSMTPG